MGGFNLRQAQVGPSTRSPRAERDHDHLESVITIAWTG
jgi:hypothetical protein